MIIEGWWCESCEFFEAEDDVNTDTDMCTACGCNGATHIPVEIIRKS